MSSISSAVSLAADLCRRFEGFSAKPYLCPAGVWTIGYGTTAKPDETRVKEHDEPITKELAQEWLEDTLARRYLPGALIASPNLSRNPERLAAITDFSYNLGVAAYRASTLRRRVNEEDWEGARFELGRWVRGGGRILPGLIKRRAAEAELMR